jgi:hypothetical protein
MKLFTRFALACGIACSSVAALNATIVTYDYSFGGVNGGNKDLGNSYTFSPIGYSSPSITAYGYTGLGGNHVSAVDLYSKGSAFNFSNPSTSSNGESGLGLVNDPSGDHEIAEGSFVVLNLNNLEKLTLTSLNLYFESTTDGESFSVWGSNSMPGNSASMPWQGVITGDKDGSVNIASLKGDEYIYITANCDSNILIGGLTAVDPSVAPEPAYTADFDAQKWPTVMA